MTRPPAKTGPLGTVPPVPTDRVRGRPVPPPQGRCRPWTPQEWAAWNWTCRPTTDADHLAWLLVRWGVDPVQAAVEVFGVILTTYQVAILLDLFDVPAEVFAFYGVPPDKPKRQVLVPSGHGLGKTRLLALAIWVWLITRRFSRVLCTAPSSDQLTGGVWAELRKLHRRMTDRWPMVAGDWDLLTAAVAHKNPAYGDWGAMARTARADTPEGLQGHHGLDDDDPFGDLAALSGSQRSTALSGGILVVLEEASGVPDVIRETLQGALSEPGARLIAAGNPTRPDGWFARDCDATDRFAVHELDCRLSNRYTTYALPYRSPAGRVHTLRYRGLVEPRYWEDVLKECDGNEDADRFRVRVRGLRPRSAFDALIKSWWVEAAQQRLQDADSHHRAAVVGLDFGLSGDKHALVVRRGFNVVDGEEWLPPDTPDDTTLQAAERAMEAQRVHRARWIVGDANGVGRGAMEVLARFYHQDHPELNVRVVFHNSGAAARDGSRYRRRRDEIWHKLGRPWLSSPRCSLPALAGLKKQLCTPGYHETTSRKIEVETKDQVKARTGEPSGNLADALLMTLVVDGEEPAAPTADQRPPRVNPMFVRAMLRLAHGGALNAPRVIR